MRHVVEIVVVMLTMLIVGVLFTAPAYAEEVATESVVAPEPAAKAPPVVTTVAKPAVPVPQAPVITGEIATTDQCFGKYSEEKDPCSLKACLLTLERETRDVVQAFFEQCKAEPPPVAVASGTASAAK